MYKIFRLFKGFGEPWRSLRDGALPKSKDIVPDAWEARKRGHVALPIVVEAAEPEPP